MTVGTPVKAFIKFMMDFLNGKDFINIKKLIKKPKMKLKKEAVKLTARERNIISKISIYSPLKNRLVPRVSFP